ncbi:hypothetical protein GCM10011517_22240 [Actibacterium pelagium]|uniref:Uncharacterized protein n=1 Tax=Actibacterium pelagium TaxID=2029103 RepID=A0A917AHZ1_9RHOB|nr:hypothetical protein GCM10011517_22240 [Actibacterium pelagium]
MGLTEFHLALLASPRARIELEFSDKKILVLSGPSLVRAIQALPAPDTSPIPGPLSKFAAEADQRIAAPGFLVPSTKPQVEFSIRSQGG